MSVFLPSWNLEIYNSSQNDSKQNEMPQDSTVRPASTRSAHWRFSISSLLAILKVMQSVNVLHEDHDNEPVYRLIFNWYKIRIGVELHADAIPCFPCCFKLGSVDFNILRLRHLIFFWNYNFLISSSQLLGLLGFAYFPPVTLFSYICKTTQLVFLCLSL